MTDITRVAIDLAKNVLQVCAADVRGAVIWNKKMNRVQLTQFMMQLEPVDVVTESCATANYWARVFSAQGHRVQLIHPQYVKPFVKTNKNDAADAEGILEASLRPTMRFVKPKSVEQQDIQLLHRRRQRLVRQYVAAQNQTRGLLAEYGIIVAWTGPGRITDLSETGIDEKYPPIRRRRRPGFSPAPTDLERLHDDQNQGALRSSHRIPVRTAT